MSKNVLKIKFETPELQEVLTQILLMNKNNLQVHINSLMNQRGLPADAKIKIQDDEMEVTLKTGDRGLVLVSQGIGMETAGYDTLPDNTKYMIVESGAVKMFLKRPDNIDIELGRFEDLETAIANVNSNDIVEAVNAILNNNKQTLLEESESTESINEDGNTEGTV